ncbi:comF family protein [Dehalogenimonas formicexedens]|uniref:ComF family protein n=1 Tax=Dehalogenimonas formicexedens TaxID=1839801 RepID=A0A1P8FAI7_9CHLR|nr:ComF family protein [Dehalogenimonas formicexedens]APV45469.1 comF family protein [Dehalogenimonas formicexedens]
MFGRLLGSSEKLLDVFFPKYCLGCGREGDYLCQRCRAGLPYQEPPYCPCCGKSLDHHPDCDLLSQELKQLNSVFRFEGVIKKAVHQLKYNNLRDIAPTLGALMADFLKNNEIIGDALVPVPLHKSRLRERGYNQAQLLALSIHKLTGLPVFLEALRKIKPTPPQADSSSVEARRLAVVGAFGCYNNFTGRRVILIDDVATSGATLSSCAETLAEAGAKEIRALTLAREI